MSAIRLQMGPQCDIATIEMNLDKNAATFTQRTTVVNVGFRKLSVQTVKLRRGTSFIRRQKTTWWLVQEHRLQDLSTNMTQSTRTKLKDQEMKESGLCAVCHRRLFLCYKRGALKERLHVLQVILKRESSTKHIQSK
jgi:hypothetical protein